MDDAERQNIAQAIRAYIARERISREEFARRTKLGKSTVDKLVTGLFSERTVIQVESHTKLKLLNGPSHDVAADEYGRYSRADVTPYLGSFTFGRPSFREPAVIEAFATDIVWDDKPPCLLVRVRDTTVPVQLGRVYMPRGTMHLFVLSNEQAWLKQLILSHLAARTMKGVMLTMGPVFGNVYGPVGMPVFMVKRDAADEALHGDIAPGHVMYDEYRRLLASVEAESFARWIGVSPESAGKV